MISKARQAINKINESKIIISNDVKPEESNLNEMDHEVAAANMIGDKGTKGAVQFLIDALEGYKKIIQSNDDGEMDDKEIKDFVAIYDHDIKVLKGIQSQLKVVG